MAEDLLNHLDGNPFGEEQGGAGVPEVVEAHVRKSRTPEKGLEAPAYEVRGIEGRSYGAGEDEIARLFLPLVGTKIRPVPPWTFVPGA